HAGTRVYVSYPGGVAVVDADTNTLITTVPTSSVSPFDVFGVAVNPAGTLVYAANLWDYTVSVIDASSNTVVATVPVPSPVGLSVNRQGTEVYVADSGSGTVSIIDAAANTVSATVPVQDGPSAFGEFISPACFSDADCSDGNACNGT